MIAFPKPGPRAFKVPKGTKRGEHLGAKRARAKEAGTLTREEWVRICQAYRNDCAWEGKHGGRLQQGHIQAIARGGEHVASNVAPICELHNVSHGTRTVEPKPGHPFRKGASK